jgi:hypothetical protein
MKKFGLGIFLILLWVSCKKEDEPEAQKTILEYLTGTSSKSWILSGGTATNAENIQIPLFSLQPPCVTDNVLKLQNNLSYELIEGATKCSATDPDMLVKANWKLDETAKTITIDRFIFQRFTLTNAVFNISEINDSNFKGKTNIEFEGQKLEVVMDFKTI